METARKGARSSRLRRRTASRRALRRPTRPKRGACLRFRTPGNAVVPYTLKSRSSTLDGRDRLHRSELRKTAGRSRLAATPRSPVTPTRVRMATLHAHDEVTEPVQHLPRSKPRSRSSTSPRASRSAPDIPSRYDVKSTTATGNLDHAGRLRRSSSGKGTAGRPPRRRTCTVSSVVSDEPHPRPSSKA